MLQRDIWLNLKFPLFKIFKYIDIISNKTT